MTESVEGDRRAIRRSALRRMLSGVVFFGAVAACSTLDATFDDCTLPCEDRLCPSGSECRNGYCVHAGSSATCSLDGGFDAGSVPGAGGARGTGGSATTSSGGETPVATLEGGADTGLEDGGRLRASSPASKSLCVGREGQLALHAAGGTPPYAWSVSGVPFELSGSDTADLLVKGTPSSAGDYTLKATVTDGAHRTADVTLGLHAYEPPRVTTKTLPPACSGLPYGATLAASDGDPGTYQWALSTEQAATPVVNGPSFTLTPGEAGSVAFTATVSDANCKSDPVELTLTIDDTAQCPRFTTQSLPAPCRASAYPAQILDVIGGKKPYTLSAPSLPAGMTFDPVARTLSGVSESDEPVLLQITDALGHVVQQSYPMTARDTCWLAYVSAAQLHLVDPLLWTDLAFPAAPVATEPVLDFAFSPDGRHLAYRIGSSTGAARLVLMSAPNWSETPVAIDGDVQRYTWSPDSRTLAAAFESDGKVYLGGLKDLAASKVPDHPVPDADGGVPDGGVPEAGETDGAMPDVPTTGRLLNPTPAPVGSELYWFGNDAVGFHSTDAYGFEALKYATLDSDAFAPTVDLDPYSSFQPDVVIRVSDDGIFAIERPQLVSFYNGFDGTGSSAYFFPGVAIDPQGRFAGQVKSSRLELFKTTAERWDLTWASADGCESLLAWAPHRERLACVGPATDHAVTLFDLDESTPPALGPSTVSGEYLYQTGDSKERRRAFSESGEWFAFTTSQAVYVANQVGRTPYIFTKDVPPGAPYAGPTELAFSPDDHWLLSQRGTAVMLHDLTDASWPPVQITNPALYVPPPANPCAEDFIADPDGWCGNPHTKTSFIWSPDSRFVAARTASGAIQAWYIKSAKEREWDTVCKEGCGDQFGFQP